MRCVSETHPTPSSLPQYTKKKRDRLFLIKQSVGVVYVAYKFLARWRLNLAGLGCVHTAIVK